MTGSKYLVTSGTSRILIDCGLFQGLKSLRLQNWDNFPVEPSSIDAIILTHAHIDHSGYIPRFIKNGFHGKIYSTVATYDLCEILLPDAGYLAEEEAQYLNKHQKSKHKPALPLFTMEDAKSALSFFEVVDFNTTYKLASNIEFELHYTGHILGAASVILQVDGKKIGFTGDVGRLNDPIFFPPEPLPPVDYLVTESTYGNRVHTDVDPCTELEKIIIDVIHREGVLIIPSFAVGRAQELMYYLWQLKKQNKIPSVPMFLNSPMATNVNKIFKKHHRLHRLSSAESDELCQVVKYVRSVEESKALNEQAGPMVIISASGMVSGGRVLHHIKNFGPDEKTTILLAGFQAAGTRGEALERGATELKIHGEYIPIRAQIKVLENMSAHADYREMIAWFQQAKIQPRMTFVTHGEPSAADSLRLRLADTLGWSCVVPERNQKFELQ